MSWFTRLFHKEADPLPPEAAEPLPDTEPGVQSTAVRHGGTLEERGRYLIGAAEHYYLSEVIKILSAGETFDSASLSLALLHVARRKKGADGAEVARELVAQGADLDFREATSGDTPLVIAIESRDLELVRALIEAGADPTLGDLAGFSPLAYCFFAQDGGMQTIAEEVRRARPRRLTANTLIQAAAYGAPALVRQAIEAGVDVNSMDKEGATALAHAAENGFLEIVELLREHGAK